MDDDDDDDREREREREREGTVLLERLDEYNDDGDDDLSGAFLVNFSS